MRDLINHDDETTCPECNGVGRVLKRKQAVVSSDEHKIYELSIPEFKNLVVDCFDMLKQRELDTSMEEYKRLTTKFPNTKEVYKPVHPDEIFMKNGKPVPKEY